MIFKKIFLILAILCTVAGALLCYRWRHIDPILFFPTFIFTIGYILVLKFVKKWLAIIILIIGIISMVLVGAMSIGVEMWSSATTLVTDIRKYEKLMPTERTEIDQHFPKKIPEDAMNISFYYLPPFLMGDGHVQLRLKRSPEEIKKLHQEFSNKKIKSFMGSDSAGEDLFLTSFLTSNSQGGKFPANYEIILLGESDWRKNRNHGDQYGVAISLEKSEIVYWLDMW